MEDRHATVAMGLALGRPVSVATVQVGEGGEVSRLQSPWQHWHVPFMPVLARVKERHLAAFALHKRRLTVSIEHTAKSTEQTSLLATHSTCSRCRCDDAVR